MNITTPSYSNEEIARLGAEIQRNVESTLPPADDGKFIAIDILTSQFEIDSSDYAAVSRLETRCPNGQLWLGRVGQPATYRMGGWR